MNSGSKDDGPGASIPGVILLLAIAAALEQLDAARRIADAVDRAGGDASDLRPGVVTWLVVAALGVVLALWVIDGLGALARPVALAALGLWLAWAALGWATLLWDTFHVKGWILAVPHALALVLVALTGALSARPLLADTETAWHRIRVVRLQVLLLAALVAVVLVVPLTAAQMTDVLRAWGDGPWTRAIAGAAAALLLGAVARASVRRSLMPQTGGSSPSAKRVAVAITAAAVAGLCLADHGWVGAGAAVVVLVLVRATKSKEPDDPSVSGTEGEQANRFGGALAVVPLAMLYVGLVLATVQSLMLGHGVGADLPLIVFTVVAGAGVGGLWWLARRPIDDYIEDVVPPPAYGVIALLATLPALLIPWDDPSGWWSFVLVPLLAVAVVVATRLPKEESAAAFWAGGGAALGATLVVYCRPIGGAAGLGTFALVMLAATGALLALHAMGAAAERSQWRFGSWGRIPVLTLLAVWLVAATVFPIKTAHQARTLDQRPDPVALDEALAAWRGSDPVVVIAASGGGAKAAYWTDLVLDCILDDGLAHEGDDECRSDDAARTERRRARIALTSSVSGGSVGIYHYLMHYGDEPRSATWVLRRAGREVLSPVTGWAAYHDVPAFLLGLRRDPRHCHSQLSCRLHADRALVQEAAVADYGAGTAGGTIVPPTRVAALGAPPNGGPLAVFNGTISGGTARVLMARANLAPPLPPGCDQKAEKGVVLPAAGSADAYDYVDRDLPTATAALLSARFPVVAPPGRLGDHGKGSCRERTPPMPPIQVRDGGYMENTGLLTVTDLLPAIRAAVGPDAPIMVVSIDDDPAVLDAEPGLTDPGLAPLNITQTAGPGYLSQLSRDRLQTGQYEGVEFVRISPEPHGGAHAATGWEVSATARQGDLVAALDGCDDPAVGAVRRVRARLDGSKQAPCVE